MANTVYKGVKMTEENVKAYFGFDPAKEDVSCVITFDKDGNVATITKYEDWIRGCRTAFMPD